jgi:hypothetical protein
MVVKTLIFDTINLVFYYKTLLFQAQSLSLVTKKKKCNHENIFHF